MVFVEKVVLYHLNQRPAISSATLWSLLPYQLFLGSTITLQHEHRSRSGDFRHYCLKRPHLYYNLPVPCPLSFSHQFLCASFYFCPCRVFLLNLHCLFLAESQALWSHGDWSSWASASSLTCLYLPPPPFGSRHALSKPLFSPLSALLLVSFVSLSSTSVL